MRLYFANRDFYQLGQSDAKKILSSYWYCQTYVLRETIRKYFKGYEDEVELFIDSGAFSAWSQGHEIKIDDYCNWISLNKEHILVYSNLDVIGNQVLTRNNQTFMESRGLSPLPVFHIGSGFRELRRLCEKYEYIAIGGMVPYMKKVSSVWKTLIKIHEIGVDNNLHGFGCTNQRALFSFPWYSVDSTTWLSGARYGEVYLFDDRKSKIVSISFGDWKSWRKYRHSVERLGFDWREVASNRTLNKATLFKLCVATFEKMEEYLTARWGK